MRSQARQVPAQDELQQTPSAQNPDRQALSAAQESPFERLGAQTDWSQKLEGLQSKSAEQLERHEPATPLHQVKLHSNEGSSPAAMA